MDVVGDVVVEVFSVVGGGYGVSLILLLVMLGC